MTTLARSEPLPEEPGDDGSAAQQEAIAHGEGPCLVLAAPGSGKTYVLTQRFIRLVRDGVPPEQILALAYNRRAADEMLDRVEAELGALSGEPPLTTYHAWAGGVVRRYGWRLGWPETVRIASGAEQWSHIAKALEDVRPRALYDPARPFEGVRDVQTLIQRAKQELLTPEEYISHAEERLRQAAPGDERLLWERHLDLARVYRQLQERYRQARLIDHDDAIVLACQLLRDDADVARAYQSLRYVMVDEYQDTNSAQAAMIEALVASHRNLMVVADDDQAIYRFRGASRVNIRGFRETFAERREIALLTNRRSTPQIVAVSRAVIEDATGREEKPIRPLRASGKAVDVVWAHTHHDEAAAVVEEVQSRLGAGAALRDIAVLSQFRADLDGIAKALRDAGLPYVAARGGDLFRAPEVKSIMAVLEAINDPEGPQALIRCCQVGQWALSVPGRQAVVQAARHDDTPLCEQLRNARITGLPKEDLPIVQRLVSDIEHLRERAAVSDIRDLFEEAMLRTCFPETSDALPMYERMRFAGNVSRFYELLDEYAAYQTEAHLDDALRYLWLVRETGSETEPPLDEEVDGVRLSTIHGSKGLEWDHVIVVACSEGKLPKQQRRERFELPAALVPAVADTPESHQEEQRRLLYVALTRARHTLTITWAKHAADDRWSKEKTRSSFLACLPAHAISERGQPRGELVQPRPRVLPNLLHDGVLVLSHSAIQDFRDCPRRFEYRRLWRMPPVFSPESWYGSRLHGALHALALSRIGGKTITAVDVAEAWRVEWESANNRGRLAHLRDEGLRLLQDYVASDHWAGAHIDAVEYPFRVAISVPLRDDRVLDGTIDRIDIADDGVPVVIDYKSGRPGTQETVERNAQLKIYGGIAAEKYNADRVRCELHWLRTGTKGTVEWTRDDLARFGYGVEMTYGEIEECYRVGHFPARPSSFQCASCPYRIVCPERADR